MNRTPLPTLLIAGIATISVASFLEGFKTSEASLIALGLFGGTIAAAEITTGQLKAILWTLAQILLGVVLWTKGISLAIALLITAISLALNYRVNRLKAGTPSQECPNTLTQKH